MRVIQNTLGAYPTNQGAKYTDQYGPRTTLRIGPYEGAMLREIIRTEKDASPGWIMAVGVAALMSRPIPPYVASKHGPEDRTPRTIAFRLTTHREQQLAEHCATYSVDRPTALRTAIWAAWIELGCPRRVPKQ